MIEKNIIANRKITIRALVANERQRGAEGFAEFKGKEIFFEFPIETADNGMRRIDVVSVEGPVSILYEFKSVNGIPPDKFAIQFIKDLNSVDDINKIRWIFDQSKLGGNFNLADYKQQFINLLKANNNFNNQKIIDLFEAYRESINYSSRRL